MYSQTYASIIVMVLAQILPHIGVTLGNDSLTTTVSAVLTIGGALWALVRRYKQGGVSVLGVKQP